MEALGEEKTEKKKKEEEEKKMEERKKNCLTLECLRLRRSATKISLDPSEPS